MPFKPKMDILHTVPVEEQTPPTTPPTTPVAPQPPPPPPSTDEKKGVKDPGPRVNKNPR